MVVTSLLYGIACAACGQLQCFGSPETLGERSEPRGGCSRLTRESEERGPWGDGFRGLLWKELPLPVAPGLQPWWGPLRV